MGTLKLKTPSGGSVAFVGQDSALDTTIVVPTGNATMVTDVALAASSAASGIGYMPVGVGAVATTVEGKMQRYVDVLDSIPVNLHASIRAGTNTVPLNTYISTAISKVLISSVGYFTLWFPPGIYTINEPLLLPANYSIDGDMAIIKALPGFTSVTRTNVGGGGTIALDPLLLYLLGDYNDISGPLRDNAFVGSGITLDCNEVVTSGIYLERMPYATLSCKVIRSIAGGNAINIGPYCWGTHLNGVTVEDFSENAISIGVGCNGITITSPRIWGKSKTGVSGILIKASANANGLAVNGGFIEKIAYGLYVARGNGPVAVNGTDFEVCTIHCIGVYGNAADTFKATVSATGCYFSATGAKIYATYANVKISASRLRSGDDFDTDAGGFISADTNQYESGIPTIVSGSNVAVDIEQSWTPVLLDDTLNPSEGQTYASRYGTFNRVGNKVHFKCSIQMSGLGTLTTAQTVRIGGLPFVASSAANSQSAVSVGFAANISTAAANALAGYIGVGADYINITKFSATTGSTNFIISELTASGYLMVSGSYVVA